MRSLLRSYSVRFGAVLLLSLAACGGSGGSAKAAQDLAPAPPHPDGGGVCAAETMADHYAAGMAKTGAAGMQVRLVSSDPVLTVSQIDYNWSIELLDKSSAPLAGATIAVTPYMPEHHHGTSIVPTVIDQGKGAYTIDHIYLFMAGLWQVTLAIQPPSGSADSSDSVAFNFCLEY